MKTLPKTIFGLVLLAMPTFAASSAFAASPSATAKDTVQVQTALSAAGVSSRETSLGNLIADALRQTGHSQIALIPADEIDGNAKISAGKVEISTLVATLRYAADPSDTVVVLNLTGAQLLKVAERSVSRAPQPFDGFLQISGLQIRYSPSQAAGSRVSLVGVGGGEVDAGKTYRVAVSRPLAGGSLGYFQIFGQKDITEDTGISISKCLSSYLAIHPTISTVVEDRITTR